jgi:RND family efflux transporter MFP subunit
MPHHDANPPALPQTEEERLRKENESLRRQLVELQERNGNSDHTGPPTKLWRPSGLTIWCLFLAAAALMALAFLAGYVPLQKRENLIRAESRQQDEALPRVEVLQVGRSTRNSEIELPGNIQAITEAPVLARASGYIQKRLVDIGDRVKAGQTLAEIEAPELEADVRQASAAVQQAHSALDEALANLEQGKADMQFARVTAERWSNLSRQGIVSRQDNDQYQSQYQSRVASVKALEKAIAVQRNSIAAADANLARLQEMERYRVVRAAFDGVITVRNVDAGALVNSGSTLLFRIAQTGTVRTYVNVPQQDAGSVRAGQAATLRVSNLPGRAFAGTVARTANALDPTSRTLLVEVHVPNPQGLLLPGMYTQVELTSSRSNPPLLIPSDALIVQADGTLVALVRPDHTVHLQKIDPGRDYGDRLEILGGLHEGDTIVANPGDVAREGVRVDPVPAAESPK